MKIGEFIKRRREELGLTLEEVGVAVGVGKSTVKKWETGFISKSVQLTNSPTSFVRSFAGRVSLSVPSLNLSVSRFAHLRLGLRETEPRTATPRNLF